MFFLPLQDQIEIYSTNSKQDGLIIALVAHSGQFATVTEVRSPFPRQGNAVNLSNRHCLKTKQCYEIYLTLNVLYNQISGRYLPVRKKYYAKSMSIIKADQIKSLQKKVVYIRIPF